ncbi:MULTISPECIES: SDR family oxidoreductase [unclassified Massilia]|uniref:SDR family oxidoreductase n=1 Tax=unclassified Massilia TaxID=2609279 RepID=UPI0017862FBE|nr:MULTISPECIES: SDR family oxidoreductase [unclassified Massilia]MBD8531038.1 SDR family oxidoreductase [Massilia sp. CFBP 13647]MBD8674738.1 SDR family oxidoreductase [Massilia sp. CFBP 13721]
MAGRLKDKVAIVTGSTQGIGRAIARLFVAEGAQVVLNSHRDDEHAARLRAELPAGSTLYVRADVARRDEVDAMVAATIARFGRVDVVVNNAGMNVFADPLALTAEEWQRCFAVDLEGAWNVSRAALPAMLAQGAGNILNIASVHGHKIIPGSFPYPIAKHALIGLTRSLAIEYAARGIRVNSISPGLIMTESAEAWLASCPDPQAERARQEALLPNRRIGEPEEVAYTALFLASDEARFINAADILVDGGRSQLYHE